MLVRARAPLRISFCGGGTDVPPYCDENGGAVLSATINRYAYATVASEENLLIVHSLDYDASISYGITDPIIYDGQLDLIKGVLDYYRRQHGFASGIKAYLHNDAPPGSGLGSSSAITVSFIRAISEYLHQPLDSYQIAELAYRIERIDVGIKGGKQDQYAATFGGFNFIEFHKNITVVNPLRLREEIINELEYRLVFAYIGGQHFSADIIQKQVDNYRNGRKESINAMDQLKKLTYEMKNSLLTGRLQNFGELLDVAWQSKKRIAEGISNPRIDEIYDETRKAGALGGKISGAGGGGFMFFFCDPHRRFEVQNKLRTLGVQLVNFSFVKDGIQAWTVLI